MLSAFARQLDARLVYLLSPFPLPPPFFEITRPVRRIARESGVKFSLANSCTDLRYALRYLNAGILWRVFQGDTLRIHRYFRPRI